MVNFNGDCPLSGKEEQRYEEELLRKRVIEIVNELSEEDLHYFLEILQYTVRT